MTLRDSHSQDGAQYGGGIEAAVSRHFHVRLDYTYSNYDRYTLVVPPTPGGDANTYDNSYGSVRLGLSYQF